MTKQERVNDWTRAIAKKYLCFAYKRRIASFKRKNCDAFAPRPKEVERRHVELWKPLSNRPSLKWFRFFANLSGIDDTRYVAEDIYHSVIERTLNDMDYAWVFADKNFYDRNLRNGNFPRAILRNIAGDYWDADFQILSHTRAREIFESEQVDVVVKPSVDSGGGKNVRVLRRDGRDYRSADGCKWDFETIQKLWHRDFLIQERINQHADFAIFNPSSVNTVRLMTYRPPTGGDIVPLKAILRMGVGESDVDNEWAGGVSIGILKSGILNNYACTKYGYKLIEHPLSKVLFSAYQLPSYDKIVETCCEVARQVPSQRLLSFDISVDSHGIPRILELNTYGQGVHVLQTFDGALFGYYTDEIIDYCVHHRPSRFRHIRLIA